jgi:hypothetical protein
MIFFRNGNYDPSLCIEAMHTAFITLLKKVSKSLYYNLITFTNHSRSKHVSTILKEMSKTNAGELTWCDPAIKLPAAPAE